MASSTNKKQLDLKKQEINYFYGKIGEVEAVLKEQKKVNGRLRQDVEAKINQLMGIEAQLTSEKEHYRWRKETLLTNMEVQREIGDARLKELFDSSAQIEFDIAEFDLVMEENEKMHRRYKKLIQEHASLTAQQSSEREERKQKDFDTRISLEVILRQVVKAADEDYKLQASAKMGSEAAMAGQENMALHAAKGKWEEMCKKMVHQQQESYEVLMRARVEKEVLSAMTSQQEVSLVVMEENNSVLLEEINQLRTQIDSLQSEEAQTELQLSERKTLKAQVVSAKRARKLARAARKAACADAINICHKVLATGLAVIEKDQKKKASKLTLGMGATDQAQEEEPSIIVASEESKASTDQGKQTSYPSRPSTRLGGPLATAFDPDEVWNSKKSDVHMAEALRRRIRQQRE